MSDFARSCVDRYCELTHTKRASIAKADTPSRKDAPKHADDDQPGRYAADAPALLMKPLYLARCARPEISYTLGRVARRISRWTRKDDRECDMLHAYLNSTVRFMLTGTIKIGCASTLFIKDFPDADLAGDADTARSTSGMWVEIYDGEGGCFPLEWSSKLQTVVSHSTPEAELVSMSRSLREFALPIQGMWSLLLDRPVKLQVLEDNMSTIEIVKKGYSSKLAHIPRTHRVSIASTAEQVAMPDVELVHCPSVLQKGDSFTKSLDKVKHAEALQSLGIKACAGQWFAKLKSMPLHSAKWPVSAH